MKSDKEIEEERKRAILIAEMERLLKLKNEKIESLSKIHKELLFNTIEFKKEVEKTIEILDKISPNN